MPKNHELGTAHGNDEKPEDCPHCGRELKERTFDFDPDPSTDKPVKVGETVVDGGDNEIITEPPDEHEIEPATAEVELHCIVHDIVWSK